jgi:predicted glycosyltransferase
LANHTEISSPDTKMLKVLIAPLNWGLGHATRCIPIINELLSLKCSVIIGADGAQKALLQEEFPSLGFVKIPGYDIKYGKNRAFTVFRLILSIPKILICIKRENRWLRRFSQLEAPDLIISDNRYGLHRPGTICVFMTHQLWINTSFGVLPDRLLQYLNYRAIRRFTCCWVPDSPGADSLAGKLSHPRKMPSIPTRYIGWLSRFGVAGERKAAGRDRTGPNVDAHADLLVILSGPEPQRSLLEKMIVEQAAGCDYKIVLVRGLPSGGKFIETPPGMVVYDHLASDRLEQAIRSSDIILSRPGYSTVMDLVRLGKKAIFIPTPGQTEQEYLGGYLAERQLAVCMSQRRFLLKSAMARVVALAATKGEPEGDAKGEPEGERLKQEIRAVLDLAGGAV